MYMRILNPSFCENYTFSLLPYLAHLPKICILRWKSAAQGRGKEGIFIILCKVSSPAFVVIVGCRKAQC